MSGEGEAVAGAESAVVPEAGWSAHQALALAFARLEGVLDAERLVLEQGRIGDLDEVVARKNQCLLDLTRLSRALDGGMGAADAGFMQDVSRVNAKLAASAATLERYVEAAREVASLVADGLRDSESDGTYAEAGPFGKYGR